MTRRVTLADSLNELAAGGIVTLPGTGSWDRTERPHLPEFVTRTARPEPPPPLAPVIWHPELAWADSAPLTPTQRDQLIKINQWLHRHRDPLIVPLRERSFDIFGTEKTLDRMWPTGLFAPNRLTLELLRTRRSRVRFTTETISAAPGLLIVENSDTFDSLTTVLRDRPDRHRIGVVGWGAGAAFEASVLSVALLAARPMFIAYFGDLDDKGLRIPAAANSRIERDSLPPVRPATGLYRALLTCGMPSTGQRRLSPSEATQVSAWLDPPQRNAAAEHLTGGTRLAQEAIGLAFLLSHEDWLSGLD